MLRRNGRQGKDTAVGDTVTLADVYLVPQHYNAVRFGVDVAKFPIISGIVASLSEREAFKLSHPSVQPDATE